MVEIVWQRYSKKNYHKGGAFNEQETNQLKEQLRRIGFVDGPEMDHVLREYGKLSQLFGGRNFDQTIAQVEAFGNNEKDEFIEWLDGLVEELEDKMETDVEDNSDDDFE